MNNVALLPASDAIRFVIRPLTANDSNAYRSLRQKILQLGDGKYFSDSYEREKTFITDDQWRDWCTETHEHCTMGTFVDGELIGIMGIVLYGPSEDKTVEWEVTWLDPRYRKFGIAKLAYEKVWQWTLDQGYERAVVFIRSDNLRSQEIRKKQGAIYTGTKQNELWADGSIADVNCYVLDVAPRAPTVLPMKRAIGVLRRTVSFLNGGIFNYVNASKNMHQKKMIA